MWEVPKEAALVAGDADGPFELVAFDNALRKAGIAELNLVPVSSIWPIGCKIVKWRKMEPGTIVPLVISKICSSTPGQKIAAAVGIAISETSHGMVSEYHDIGITQKMAARTAEDMVRYMMERRGLEPTKVTSVSAGHVVEQHGAALAAVVFIR
ncbi:MAG: arginine decarboxylase, pyruvoyl-dependent [Candidatus Hadarchaeum sp.]|uniref:pyruvoyl-dependent arginine decarboxylase n=1 Tax=Candidatus Hadarchaeum sp. TaxID=2883567 RepID=UPI00316F0ECD